MKNLSYIVKDKLSGQSSLDVAVPSLTNRTVA